MFMSNSQQQQHRGSKQSNSTRNSNKRSIDEMMGMEGDDQDDLKTTAATATAAVDQTGSIQDEVLQQATGHGHCGQLFCSHPFW
jgi:hypothetical protein